MNRSIHIECAQIRSTERDHWWSLYLILNICFDQIGGLFTDTYHTNQPNVGKYAIHGSYEYKLFIAYSNLNLYCDHAPCSQDTFVEATLGRRWCDDMKAMGSESPLPNVVFYRSKSKLKLTKNDRKNNMFQVPSKWWPPLDPKYVAFSGLKGDLHLGNQSRSLSRSWFISSTLEI